MHYHEFQQNNAFVATSREIRSSISIPDWKSPIFCPKPRRVGVLTDNAVRPWKCSISHKPEVYDSSPGAELLDLLFNKEDFGAEHPGTRLASSPPFFSGSPPSRTTNPVVQDARFVDEKEASLSPILTPSGSSSPSSSAHKGGNVRKKYGDKPAAVRVEGFVCLNRDHQCSSIPAVAY